MGPIADGSGNGRSAQGSVVESKFRGLLAIVVTAGAFGWAFVRSGPSPLPNLSVNVQAIDAWPRLVGSQWDAFIAYSPLALLVQRLSGVNSETDLVRWSLVASVLALFLLGYWQYSCAPDGQRLRAMRIVFLAPIAAVMFTGLGAYDPVTVVGLGALLFAVTSSRSSLYLTSGLLLGLAHFELAIFAFLALILILMSTREVHELRISRRHVVVFLTSAVVARLFVEVMIRQFNTSPPGRGLWIESELWTWTATAANIFPLLVWSLFAGTWLIVFVVWNRMHSVQSQLLFLGAIAVGLFVLAISGDRPRTFVLAMTPALGVIIYLFLRSERTYLARVAEAVCWVAVPLVFWSNNVWNSEALNRTIMLFEAIRG